MNQFYVNSDGHLCWLGFPIVGVHEMRSTVADYVYPAFTLSEAQRTDRWVSWCG